MTTQTHHLSQLILTVARAIIDVVNDGAYDIVRGIGYTRWFLIWMVDLFVGY